MNVNDEIHKLLGAPSQVLRSIPAESFLNLAIFNQSFQPEAVKVTEYLKLLGFRLENVVWNVKPPYSVLLRLIGASQRRYFVASTGSTLRVYQDCIDDEHLLRECHRSVWTKLLAAIVKKEFGDQ
jgi:hypothetical protein